tara:strand:+ start:28 stop:390 length:363 start_codon:yes stop_codon:yes gene_type:complete
MEIQLTKREYLGVGYIHQFKNDETDEIVLIPCTEEEYTRMGGEGGSQFNPVMKGHTWECSFGGTYKVDTPTTLMGGNEYCIVGEEAVIILPDLPIGERMKVIPKGKIVDNKVNTDLWQSQ